MSDEITKTLWEKIGVKITLGVLLTLGSGGIAFWINYNNRDYEIEQRIAPTPQKMLDLIKHEEEVPNAVDNYKAMNEIIAIDKKTDTAYAWITARFKEDIEKRKLDSLNTVSAINSRYLRDSLFKEGIRKREIVDSINNARYNKIEREQTNTTNAINAINTTLKKLDTIN